MILDASAAIALRSADDPHAPAVARVVIGADELIIHPVTLAESLVVPARAGRTVEALRLLTEEIGIRVESSDSDEPARVADLRAATGIALPDCYPLALAERRADVLVTFDARLAGAARARGITVVP